MGEFSMSTFDLGDIVIEFGLEIAELPSCFGELLGIECIDFCQLFITILKEIFVEVGEVAFYNAQLNH